MIAYLFAIHLQRLAEAWAIRYAEQWTYIALMIGDLV